MDVKIMIIKIGRTEFVIEKKEYTLYGIIFKKVKHKNIIKLIISLTTDIIKEVVRNIGYSIVYFINHILLKRNIKYRVNVNYKIIKWKY